MYLQPAVALSSISPASAYPWPICHSAAKCHLKALRIETPLQVGLATDKAQYIHRLGRTARAGKSGKGMLLLGDFEERFLNSLSELPLAEAAPLPASALTEAQAQVQQGLAAVDEEDKSQVSCDFAWHYSGYISVLMCHV